MSSAWLARSPLRRCRRCRRSRFGDLFLEDVRAYREERLEAAGRRGVFPLWRQDTTLLALRFIEAGFRAILVPSVD